jgi:hypothetical protein
MKTFKTIGVALAIVATLGACEVFQDQSPETLALRITGSDGAEVVAIYSTAFVAGVNELNVTQVRIFTADTVSHVLPIDTVFSIAANQQFFAQVGTVQSDTVDVSVRIEIDGRNVLDLNGLISPIAPWIYVYQFNQLLTDIVEVIL